MPEKGKKQKHDVYDVDSSPRRGGQVRELMANLEAYTGEMTKVASAVSESLAELKEAREIKEASKEPDCEWTLACRRRLPATSKFPDDLLTVFRQDPIAALVDPRMRSEPLMWPMYCFWLSSNEVPSSTDKKQWTLLNAYSSLNEAGKQWRDSIGERYLRAHGYSTADERFVAEQMRKLETHFKAAARAFDRFPSSLSAETFFAENYDIDTGSLQMAAYCIKELEGKLMSVTVGHRAAKEYFALWRFQRFTHQTGATTTSVLSKVRVSQHSGNDDRGRGRGDRGGHKRTRDDDRGRGRGNRGGRGDRGGRGNRGGRGDRGGRTDDQANEESNDENN